MGVKQNNAEGATTGTALTTANQNSAGDVLTPVKTGSAAIVAQTATVITGTESYEISGTTTDSGYLMWTEATPLAACGYRAYFYFASAPSVDTTIMSFYGASGNLATVKLRSGANAGRFYFLDAAGAGYSSLAGEALTFPATFAVDATIQPGSTTGNGKMKMQLFNSASATTPYGTAMTEITTANLGASGTVYSVRAGKVSGSESLTYDIIVDNLKRVDSYGFVGPVGANVPPAISVGSTQTVAVGNVTLAATATDSDGTITALTWALTSGPDSPGVTTTNTGLNTASATGSATVAVTAGVYVFTATATDNSAATNTATTTVYVYPASGTNDTVASVQSTTYTNVGGAANILAALNDGSATTYAQSVAAPAAAVLPITLNPIGPGNITIYVSGSQSPSSPLITRVIKVYKADGTTLVYTQASFTLTTTDTETAVVLDSTALALIPTVNDRQALIVTITDTSA